LLLCSSLAVAQFKHLNLDNGVALNGFDPVTYFNSKEPSEGTKKFALVHDGATYYFLSAENREKFKTDPGKFLPAYGGWCAYAMGDTGEKVEVDPETFKIINGKLYLFYNKFFTNTLTSWNKNETKLKIKADENWKKYSQN
jgi:YHS domain-containing protein